jgi:hypothetical protein
MPLFFHPVDTSSSELKTWDQCGAAWFLKYVLMQRSKSTKSPMIIGGIVHDILAEYYEPTTEEDDRDLPLLVDILRDVYKERLTIDLKDSNLKVWKTVYTMIAGYWNRWGGRDWTMLDTEVNFKVGIFLGDHLVGFVHGRLDGSVILKDAKIWIVDHKTSKQFKTAHFPVDPQIDLYSLAGSKLFGASFGGIIINYIRSKKSHRSPNFQRIPIVRSSKELALIEYNTALKLVDMGSVSPSQIYFAPSRDCSWKCAYFAFCQGLRAGTNPEVLLSRLYEHRIRPDDPEFD